MEVQNQLIYGIRLETYGLGEDMDGFSVMMENPLLIFQKKFMNNNVTC
jgi:hypothetical protein